MPESLNLLLNRFSSQLQEAGNDSPRLDARILLAASTNRSANDLILHSSASLSEAQIGYTETLIRRRLKGEPISRILGEREFWGLPFKLSSATLDPRPETETIVTTVLSLAKQGDQTPKSILDLGTGSGCLLLSLLSEWPNAMGIGVDIVSGAAAKARENAEELGLSDRATFLVGNWLSSMSGSFDVIVCNPPYIRRSEIDKLQPEVRLFDPKRALDGGADGLAAYRELIPKCEEHLAVGGLLVFEIGASQDEAVAEIFLASGLHRIEGHRDLTGCVRCLSATAP